jgi:serine/threonine-protein kinase
MVRFGSCDLDAERRRLSSAGRELHLTPKAFQLLVLLIDSAPRVVSKRELHDRLWPNGLVSDATLVGLVKELRRVLHDGPGDAPIIRTVYKVGYAFDAPLEQCTRERPVLPRRSVTLSAIDPATAEPTPRRLAEFEPRAARPFFWRLSAVAAVLTAAASAALWWSTLRFDSNAAGRMSSARQAARVARFALQPESSIVDANRSLAIAPNGARIAYVSDRGVVVRSLERLDATLLSGVGAFAGAVFFSPDGAWVGYGHDTTLKKIAADGGSPVTIAATGAAPAGHWSDHGIVFADTRGLFRVPADGGVTEALPLRLEPNSQATHPQLLSDRRAVIFTVIPTTTNTPGPGITQPTARIEALDLVSGRRHTVVHGGGGGRYVATGHLVYAAGNALRAVPFDLDRLEAQGDPVTVESASGPIDFAVSDNGTLVFTARLGTRARSLVWVDRQGREDPLGTPDHDYVYPRLSPDGTRVALDLWSADRDIWIWDVAREVLERFTVDPAGNALVAWSPDGRYLAFGSDRFGISNLFRQLADGSGSEERLLDSDRLHQPLSFAPDGRLLFSAEVPGASRDIHALSLDTRAVQPVIESPGSDLTAEVSPDGRWIAYDSDDSGQFEVYVRPYPDTVASARVQISSGGGRQPLWSRDGSELFYRDFDGALIAVPVTLHPSFSARPAVELFKEPSYLGRGSAASGRTYDVSPDGSRFLMIKQNQADDVPARSIVVVLNWFEELQRLVPIR